MAKKLLYLVAEESYFWSHRLYLARAARDAGFRVYVATHIQDSKERFDVEGFIVCETNFSRSNRGIFKQLQSLWQIRKIVKEIRPDVMHMVGVKSVIFAGFATILLRVPRRIYALMGLGTLSIERKVHYRMWALLVWRCMRLIFQRPESRVIVQNQDDFNFVRLLAPQAKVSLIRGSGVDIDYFLPRSSVTSQTVVSLVARMISQKGILEFIEVSRIFKAQNIQAKFLLVGGLDRLNPSSISQEQLQAWQQEDLIEWMGYQKDILAIWNASHIAVLPSYREGLPKSLLEAASCALPLVAFDVPGCREVIQDGKNGFLVPSRDVIQLADRIRMLVLDPQLRIRMGRCGRQLVTEKLSYRSVNQQTLALYESGVVLC